MIASLTFRSPGDHRIAPTAKHGKKSIRLCYSLANWQPAGY